MRFAIIKGGKVENIINADQAFIDERYPGAVDATLQDVAIGDDYDRSKMIFSSPAQNALSVDEFRAAAIHEIYTVIDVIHNLLLAGPAAQDTIYTMKADEAAAYIAAGYPTSGAPYPMLAAESASMGVTKKVAADLIIATRSGWYALLGSIEGIRRTAATDINAASDATGIETIKTTAITALQAL